MLLPFVLAVCGATLGAGFAVLSLAFARAPGWGALGWFALAAGTAALFCACFALQVATPDDRLVEVLARVGVSLAAVHVAGWVGYSGVGPRRLAGALRATTFAIAALALAPGALVSHVVVRHLDAWTHSAYVNVQPTAFGATCFAVLIGILWFPIARYWAPWRSGDASAGAHVLALAGIALTGAAEATDSVCWQSWPRLIPVGLVVAIVAVGSSLARRFVKSARAYQALSLELDATVTQRTAELAGAMEKNLQLENLAALGSLSAAVAHEINNPAAAASANVRYLMDTVTTGAPAADALDVMRDLSDSIGRVVRVVKQLALAGDHAARSHEPAPVHVADTVRWASADAHPEVPQGIRISMDVPDGLYARSEADTLRQVVTALVVSAIEAMRAAGCTGTVRVQGARESGLVVLRVVDPCPAPDPERLARRLDPFLSAQPVHVARGVGLAVSVALLRIFGGTLALERSGTEGSTVRVALPAAEPPKRVTLAPGSAPASRARVLVVDDDALLRIGLRRLLGREYALVEAGSVDEALACVRADPDAIDAIVCDLVMPDGGAPRLFEELVRTAPELVEATVLMTGGAVDEETEAFLDAHAPRVLRKPIDVAELRAMIQQVRRSDPGRGARMGAMSASASPTPRTAST
jgi:signal transduction histidine kinase/CheY-like chemotaxis protein